MKVASKKAVKQKSDAIKIARGKIGFTVEQSYRAPMQKVWDGATKKAHIQKHFVDKVSGDFNEKFEMVTWFWKAHGEQEIYPVGYAPGKFLEFYWPLYGSKDTFSLVRFEFAEKKGIVTLKITESGWSQTGLKYAFANCSGWTEFLMTLKAHVLLGKDLRTKRK